MQVPLPACTRSLTIPARCKEGGAHSLGSGRSSSMPYQDGVTSPSHPETSTAQVRDHGQQLATQQQQQQQQQVQQGAQQEAGSTGGREEEQERVVSPLQGEDPSHGSMLQSPSSTEQRQQQLQHGRRHGRW
mmetsp:Transcript_28367/g.72975  ORF Transcript_28367/g.72975 Transcript_28367/m.72975 type:complete len:131 (-) Transcript_28367:55-447(-)